MAGKHRTDDDRGHLPNGEPLVRGEAQGSPETPAAKDGENGDGAGSPWS